MFHCDLKKILVGQNIIAAPAKYAMARLLLSGEALMVFNTGATENGNLTNNNVTLTLQTLTTHIFPQRSLAFKKFYMRRHMRKPREMTTRAFATQVAKLKSYLEEFPPFEDNQELDDTKIMDILENGLPNTWSKNMVSILWKAPSLTCLLFVKGTSSQKEPWIIAWNQTKRRSPKLIRRIAPTKRNRVRSPLRRQANITKNGPHPLISGAIYTKHLATALLSVKWFNLKLQKCVVAENQFVLSLMLTLILLLILRLIVNR
jgi:hypothetical protein